MFIKRFSADELAEGFKKQLQKVASEHSPEHQKIEAIKLLDKAAEILEAQGFSKQANRVVDLMEKIADEQLRNDKLKDDEEDPSFEDEEDV